MANGKLKTSNHCPTRKRGIVRRLRALSLAYSLGLDITICLTPNRNESIQPTKFWGRSMLIQCWFTCFLVLSMALLSSACTRPFRDPNSTGLIAATREKLFPKKEMGQIRLWRPDLAIMPFAEFQDEDIVIKHVRNCRYRSESDYDVRHYDMRFALADVNHVDFLIVPFQNNSLLAHTMFSFGLRDGRHFIISVEARLDYGASYSPIRGIVKNFELMYLIGDERDLIPLRTDARKAEVYLYPGRATPDQVQNLLVDMLERANQLQRVPENYDTINNNCTTNLVNHINKLRPGSIPADWRVLLPGHSDRLAYELGLLDIIEPFEIAREKARITSVANLYKDSLDFSAKIREHISR